MPHVLLLIVAFVSGACVMMLEIVGSRLMGPYVGSSLHTWTALISVILGAMSLGYVWGGKLVDRHPSYTWLGGILIVSGIFVACIKIVEILVFPLLTDAFSDVRVLSLLGGFLLFGPANILLGMVSPFVVRLYISSVKESGKSAGTVYAVSTFGSIVGTIGSGFFLLPYLGHGTLLIIIACTLFVCGGLLFSGKLLVIALGIGIALFSQTMPFPYIDIDTNYNRVWIIHGMDDETKRPVTGLKTDPYGVQTVMYSDSDTEPASDYIKFFRIASGVQPDLHRVLVVGGGGYAYPKDYLCTYPDGTIDVVELDPGITAIAKQYFHLPNDVRLTTYHKDGRLFLAHSSGIYDAIFYDAFGQGLAPPFSLVTKEAFIQVSNHVSPKGVFVFNIISALAGPKSELFRSVVMTMNQVFPDVSVFAVRDPADETMVQNIIIVAGKERLSFPSEYMSHRFNGAIAPGRVLTDDYAPVEYLARNLYN